MVFNPCISCRTPCSLQSDFIVRISQAIKFVVVSVTRITVNGKMSCPLPKELPLWCNPFCIILSLFESRSVYVLHSLLRWSSKSKETNSQGNLGTFSGPQLLIYLKKNKKLNNIKSTPLGSSISEQYPATHIKEYCWIVREIKALNRVRYQYEN